MRFYDPAHRFDQPPGEPVPVDQPLLIDGKHTSFVTGYGVGVVQITDEMADVHGGPVGPALVLNLRLVHGHADRGAQEVRAIIFPLPETPDLPDLPGGRESTAGLRDALYAALTQVLEAYDDPTMFDESTRKAHEANLAAGFLGGAPRPRCPGCGAALFGEVAIRGACLACYPDLPPGDAVLPDLTWPEARS